jgi:hypothetical protein
MDEIEVRVGGLRLLLSRADAMLVAEQLAEVGITPGQKRSGATNKVVTFQTLDESGIFGKPSTKEVGQPIADDDLLWSMHSGGTRYEGPEWQSGDEALARTLQDRLTRYTAAFHRLLVDHAGRRLSVEDLSKLTEGTDAHLSTNRVVAGAVAGYANWCESIDRRFPFCWWEGRNGGSATYAMQQRVAMLFRAVRN